MLWAQLSGVDGSYRWRSGSYWSRLGVIYRFRTRANFILPGHSGRAADFGGGNYWTRGSFSWLPRSSAIIFGLNASLIIRGLAPSEDIDTG